MPIMLKISPDQYNIPVERLELSSRTLNCLKRAGVDKVGQVLSMRSSELLQIRNFGEKSLTELCERLTHMGLPLPQDDEEPPAGDESAAEPAAEEPETVAVVDGERAEEG